jgi:formylglycine-generating enzyme required for sulfatase activity
MGKVEVTQAQWEAVMRNPHVRPNSREGEPQVNPSQFKGPTLPAENVPWDAVQQFIQRLNTRDPKHVFRLPTEAEWEYAARAGAADEPLKNLESIAWYEPNSGGHTQPVGQKTPNGWGLYDMQGNVREWVQDWYGAEYYEGSPQTDPHGPASGSYKVYRGCGWFSAAQYCRAAFRGFDFPGSGEYSVGFRLVRMAK